MIYTRPGQILLCSARRASAYVYFQDRSNFGKPALVRLSMTHAEKFDD